MCSTDFFHPTPSYSNDRIPIPIPHVHVPIVVYKNIPIPFRNEILIPIPSHFHCRTWYSKFRTSNDYLE